MRNVFAIAATITAMSAAWAASPPRLSLNSFGQARVGMTAQALTKALGAPLTHLAPEAEEEGCYYATVRGLPKGVSLMMLNNRLARIDVDRPGVLTLSGAGVGLSESEVKRLYGANLSQSPHAYTGPEGHYLTLLSNNGRYGLRFETDGKAIIGFYAGTSEAIQYIEGCQ